MEELARGGRPAPGPADPSSSAPPDRPRRRRGVAAGLRWLLGVGGGDSPESIAAFWIGADGAHAVAGLAHRGSFHGIRWASVRGPGPESATSRIRRLVGAGGIAGSCVGVSVPGSLLTTRHLRLPSRDPEEIRAMTFHQLSLTLPVDVQDIAWDASVIEEGEDGFSTVLVHVLRRDQLDAHLRPVREAGLEVGSAIPEGRVLAHLIPRLLGPGAGERTVLLIRGGESHLLVEREGRPLYHKSCRVGPSADAPSRPGGESAPPALLAGEIRHADAELRRALGRGLPAPIILLAGLAPGEGDEAEVADLAGRLRERIEQEVEAVSPGGDDGAGPARGERPPPLALAVAELASAGAASLLPAETTRELDRRSTRSAVLRLLSLLGVASLLGGAFLAGNLQRSERKLELLRARVEAERAAGEELERMSRELRAAQVRATGEMELLRVLASLQESIPASVRFQKLSYERAGRVHLQGTAAALRQVTDLTERMAADPLWSRVAILRLHRPGKDESADYHFEIEGTLGEGAASPSHPGETGAVPRDDR